jgi:hypothetical protein
MLFRRLVKPSTATVGTRCGAFLLSSVPSASQCLAVNPLQFGMTIRGQADLPVGGADFHDGEVDGAPASAPRGGSESKPGDWICPACQANNFARRNACFKCYAPREGFTAPPTPAQRGGGNFGMKRGDWVCTGCQTHNFAKRQNCLNCERPRPLDADGGRGGGNNASRKKFGDWKCDCGFTNFASRAACLKCDAAKPAAQAVAGDWLCKHCGTNNFSKRNECFGCQKPKDE